MPEEEKHESENEGQLAVDVYQDDHNVYLVAPIAGVKSADIAISITDEVVTIRGERSAGHDIPADKHFVKECYWGTFSRSFVLPILTDSDQAKAVLEDGLLRITIPKDDKAKTKFITVEDNRGSKTVN